jgi:hypothetical protein
MVFNQFVKSTKDGVYSGLQHAPLFLGSSLLTIGTASANYSFLYLFIGMWALVPLSVILLSAIPYIELFKGLKTPESIFPAEMSTITASLPESIQSASYGYSMMIFFFSYLITNASYLIKTNENSVVRGRASISILIVGLSALAYIFFRLKNFEKTAESITGLFILGVAAIILGWAWYYLLYSCGKSSIADVFGVENNVAVSKGGNKVCVAFA